MSDGIPGGRSTYGECFGALSWLVEDGRIGDVDVTGLVVVLVVRYHDDEALSPWTIVLHVDARGDEGQRTALADVFLGKLGGPKVGALPWVRKARHLVDVRTSADRADARRRGLPPRGRLTRCACGATAPVPFDAVVRCGIPGYDEPGRELVAEELRVSDDPFAYELSDNCAFASRFAYASG